jgi:1-acyl-sn-glycerol-3-phosphate acyltransferase
MPARKRAGLYNSEHMLPAQKHPVLNQLVYRALVLPALRSSFERISLRSTSHAPVDAPVILCVNHSAWWDGYMCMLLNERILHRSAYVMIEDTQLQRYQFLRWTGGFSVNRSNPRSATESLTYAAHVLSNDPRAMLIIYPQGEILGNDVRPLKFFSGVGHIAKNVVRAVGRCAVLPCALRYEFVGEQKPQAFIHIGEPLLVESESAARAITTQAEAALTRDLDALHDDVTHYRLADFDTLMTGAASINRIWDAVRGRGQIRKVESQSRE